MRRFLLVTCLVVGFAAGCEEKAPTQAGPKAVTIHTTDGARTTTP